MLKLAVFDLDGTLIELEHEHLAQRIEITLQRMSLFCPPQAEILGLIREHKVNTLFSSAGERAAFWDNYTEGECPPVRLFDKSLATIEEVVSRGLQTAIATARVTRHDEMREHLAASGLLRHVSCITTFYGTEWKDKEEQLRGLCKSHGVEPKASMMVGDSEDDLRSSRNVGFSLRLGKVNGITHPERLLVHRPKKLISCISEVPAAVDEYHESLGS